jgi:hypothetical protein
MDILFIILLKTEQGDILLNYAYYFSMSPLSEL